MGKCEFKSKAALDRMIEGYFNECDVAKRAPTVHGLALTLGFTTAEELLQNREDGKYGSAIRKAVTRVGQYAEERLMSTGTGARYALALNLPARKDEAAAEDVMAEVRARLRGRDDG